MVLKAIFQNSFWKPISDFVLQISSGTNKLYDPLNGLFGTSLKIINYLDDKNYPKDMAILIF